MLIFPGSVVNFYCQKIWFFSFVCLNTTYLFIYFNIQLIMVSFINLLILLWIGNLDWRVGFSFKQLFLVVQGAYYFIDFLDWLCIILYVGTLGNLIDWNCIVIINSVISYVITGETIICVWLISCVVYLNGLINYFCGVFIIWFYCSSVFEGFM